MYARRFYFANSLFVLASWRQVIGDSGLLGFFLSIIANQDLRLPLKIHTLRLIGNSCADTGKDAAALSI